MSELQTEVLVWVAIVVSAGVGLAILIGSCFVLGGVISQTITWIKINSLRSKQRRQEVISRNLWNQADLIRNERQMIAMEKEDPERAKKTRATIDLHWGKK